MHVIRKSFTLPIPYKAHHIEFCRHVGIKMQLIMKVYAGKTHRNKKMASKQSRRGMNTQPTTKPQSTIRGMNTDCTHHQWQNIVAIQPHSD